MVGLIYQYKIEATEELEAFGVINIKRPSFPQLMRLLKECGYSSNSDGQMQAADRMEAMCAMIDKIGEFIDSVNVSYRGQDITDWETLIRMGEFWTEIGKIVAVFSSGFKGGKN